MKESHLFYIQSSFRDALNQVCNCRASVESINASYTVSWSLMKDAFFRLDKKQTFDCNFRESTDSTDSANF